MDSYNSLARLTEGMGHTLTDTQTYTIDLECAQHTTEYMYFNLIILVLKQ